MHMGRPSRFCNEPATEPSVAPRRLKAPTICLELAYHRADQAIEKVVDLLAAA
jgi:hypothetical protein